MSRVFISFSGQDRPKIRKLFSALELQKADIWDYSDAGQELPLAHDLSEALRRKINSCEYFIAVISANSIDETIGFDARLEVRYAIAAGKAERSRILPVILSDAPVEWMSLYERLRRLLRVHFDDDSAPQFNDTIRRICDWLGITYKPPSLSDPRVFFSELLLKELENNDLEISTFVELMNIGDACASKFLAGNWPEVQTEIELFLGIAARKVPAAGFYYAGVIKGVTQLELRQIQEAEQTFLNATTNQTPESNPLLNLGFAGLAQVYLLQGRHDEACKAFQQAKEAEPSDQPADAYLQFNYLGSLVSIGGSILDDSVLELFDLSNLPAAERMNVFTLLAEAKYKRGDYYGAIKVFDGVNWNELSEAAAAYYALALQDSYQHGPAIELLCFAANKLKTPALYHHLANNYHIVGEVHNCLKIYEDVLWYVHTPISFARQILIEYAQLVRQLKDGSLKARLACERAVDLKVFPKPESDADWFYAGFAYHLLGEVILARHYFDMSSGFSAVYYDELELKAENCVK